MTGRQPLARRGGGGGGGRRNAVGASIARAGTQPASAAQALATGATSAISQALRCASCRVVGDHRHARVRSDQRAGLVVEVEPERACADRQYEVVRRERLAKSAAPPGQMAGEQPVVLRKTGAAAKRLLPYGTAQRFRQRDDRLPALLGVGAGADHDRGRRRVADQVGDLRHLLSGDAARAEDPAGRGRGELVGRLVPIAHRHDHERRAGARLGLVVGAGDRARHVLGAVRDASPHGVLARETVEMPAGQERFERELATILLTDEDDQRRAAVACVGDRVDRIAEARRGVQVDEGGRSTSERVAGRHPDHRALVQTEHEFDVIREIGQERDLGGARVAEDPRQTETAHNVEGRVADGGERRRGRRRVACVA